MAPSRVWQTEQLSDLQKVKKTTTDNSGKGAKGGPERGSGG